PAASTTAEATSFSPPAQRARSWNPVPCRSLIRSRRASIGILAPPPSLAAAPPACPKENSRGSGIGDRGSVFGVRAGKVKGEAVVDFDVPRTPNTEHRTPTPG